jgi:hypothetical protein
MQAVLKIGLENAKSCRTCRILAITALVLIIALAVSLGTLVKVDHDLAAGVRYEGTQFHITNNNDYPWTDVRLVLNAYNSDYKLNVPAILPHSEFTAESNRFVNDGGTAYDSSYLYQTDFYINAVIPENQWGSWFYKFR